MTPLSIYLTTQHIIHNFDFDTLTKNTFIDVVLYRGEHYSVDNSSCTELRMYSLDRTKYITGLIVGHEVF